MRNPTTAGGLWRAKVKGLRAALLLLSRLAQRLFFFILFTAPPPPQPLAGAAAAVRAVARGGGRGCCCYCFCLQQPPLGALVPGSPRTRSQTQPCRCCCLLRPRQC